MDEKRILEYLPTIHGEHGVDSVIHRSVEKNSQLYECYSNPPGASWAEIIIQNPTTSEYYSWDHIPREPNCAKRPDAIIQFNEDREMNLLAIESKEKISNIYDDIDQLLKNFFVGSTNFNGLFSRPTRNRKNPITEKLEYVGNDDAIDTYWVQNIQDTIKIHSGFAFGFQPEFYENKKSFDEKDWKKKMKEIRDGYSLDIIIGIEWHGLQHMPFTEIVVSDVFSQTQFYSHLKSSLI